MVVGMLGAWKAGAAWVPLDPDLPADRLAWVVADAGIRVVVTGAGAETADGLGPVSVTNSPRSMARFSPSTACTALGPVPKVFSTACMRIRMSVVIIIIRSVAQPGSSRE